MLSDKNKSLLNGLSWHIKNQVIEVCTMQLQSKLLSIYDHILPSGY